MNIFNIVEELEKVDPELNDRFNPRRAAIKNITSFGSKVAVAALPFALSTLFKRAYGQAVGDIGNITGVLNFALKLEYLEAAFYTQGVATTGLITAADVASITQIRDHENAHVTLLKTAITGLNATPVAQASQGNNGVYNFTTAFPTVFTNYDTFLAVANALEDTGVRAYKGQAPNLIGNPVLTTALNIHSVEARHAAHIRQIRQKRGGAAANLKPWISGSASISNDTGIGSAVDGNYGAGVTGYPAENNTMQGGVTLTTLPAVSGTTSVTAAIESFDEPLDYATVVSLVSGFGVK